MCPNPMPMQYQDAVWNTKLSDAIICFYFHHLIVHYYLKFMYYNTDKWFILILQLPKDTVFMKFFMVYKESEFVYHWISWPLSGLIFPPMWYGFYKGIIYIIITWYIWVLHEKLPDITFNI